MQFFGILITIIVVIGTFGNIQGWPVSKPEVGLPSLKEIPQWHCLRYFKHDIHLMRRCRNYRMLRRPMEVDTDMIKDMAMA